MKKNLTILAGIVLAAIFVVWIVAFKKRTKPDTSTFSFKIDNNLKPDQQSLPGTDHSNARETGVITGPSGKRNEFVLDEIVFKSSTAGDLDSFIVKYGGKILNDGKSLEIEGASKREISEVDANGSYLIKIDINKSDLIDLPANAAQLKLKGEHRFSNEKALKLYALILRESKRWKVGVNFVAHYQAINEHPTSINSYLDASTWWWMKDCQVVKAWDYLKYQGVPPVSGTWQPSTIALVDGGFDLDEMTGLPNLDNKDYAYSGLKPLQADFIDFDGTAGGENHMNCGGGPCPWHGQSVFGVACAYPRNLYGGAGTGGEMVRPMLLKVDASFYSMAQAIRSAVVNGADVINLSLGGDCGNFSSVCDEALVDNWGGLYHIGITDMKSAVALAFGWNVPCIAAAGNEKTDISGQTIYPLSLPGVIGVGSVNQSKMNVYNYGSEVDIWAPTGIYSTVDRKSSAFDNDNFGANELVLFNGTSASTPFVSGIVGLMKTLNPGLHPEEVQNILQSTADRSSTDPTVKWGFIDAFNAVNKVKPNRPPTLQIVYPQANAIVPWQSGYIFTIINDPEPGANLPQFFDQYKVVCVSDRDGIVGTFIRKSVRNGVLGIGGSLRALSPGLHKITITVTDPFGASGTKSITINSINRPPSVQIIHPTTGLIARSHEEILLEAQSSDPDEGALPIHWTSSIDGDLGTFYQLKRTLSTGQHQLRATVTDAMGLNAQAIKNITVLPQDGRPTAKIISPAGGDFIPGQTITFQGSGTDTEDGAIPASSLKWSSDKDGFLGSGTILTVQLSGPASPCNPEYVTHKITLTVTDRDGHESSSFIIIRIGRLC